VLTHSGTQSRRGYGGRSVFQPPGAVPSLHRVRRRTRCKSIRHTGSTTETAPAIATSTWTLHSTRCRRLLISTPTLTISQIKNMPTSLLIVLCLAPVLWSQESKSVLVDRLTKDPTDDEAIRGLSGDYDPRVIAAFKGAFDAVSDPEDKGLIAFNLIDDGEKDRKYFDYLAERAAVAISNDAPSPLVRDSSGKEIRGQMSPAFEEWCRNHQRKISSCTADYLYPYAVAQLALLGDERAADVLMSGLRSRNPVVVMACAGGLGVLGRNDALPIIAERLMQLPSDIAFGLASLLGDYHSAAAEALMDRYIPDKDMRERLKSGSQYGLLRQRRKDRGVQ
jgi:hypothetical protein